MPPIPCKTCSADNQDELEAVGLRAVAGEISWREAARLVGWSRHQALQSHMEKHYEAPAVANETDLLDGAINNTIAELLEGLPLQPAAVRPLHIIAIVNLRKVKESKSHSQLIQALKTAQEMTGMRQEQRMMLSFMEAKFKEKLPLPLKVLENVTDAEVIDLEASA